jgi:hypothetical protein
VLEEYNSVLELLVAHAVLASSRAVAAAGLAGLEVELRRRALALRGVNAKHDSGITDHPVHA